MDIEAFSFRDGFAGRGVATNVCIARREQSEPILPLAEIDNLFHGYALFTAEGGAEFVGVWGTRKTSRFRRMLRERGGVLKVVPSAPAARLKRWVTHGKARVS